MSITENKINEIVTDLKNKGYYKTFNNDLKYFDFRIGGFHDENKAIFLNKLKKEYLSVKDSNKYFLTIIDRLDEFPNKEYKGYEKYIKYSSMPSFQKVLNEFEDKFYKKNNMQKKSDVKITANNSASNDLQILINADIFTDNNGLIKYDYENKLLIPVTIDNIGDFIGSDNPVICKRIYTIGNNYRYGNLINVFDSKNDFANARNTDNIKESCKADYNYIVGLIESFRK